MASTRPPGTYSPSARTGRRGGGSGSVAGMVRRADSDALSMSLRSTAPVGSSAASIRRRNRPNTAFRFRGCMTSCTTMISAFRRAGALPVVIACAWAETNVYQPAWAASLSSFFARSLSRLSWHALEHPAALPRPEGR